MPQPVPPEQGPSLRLHIVNPNTTGSMTQGVAAAALKGAADVAISACEPESGPAWIRRFYDGAFAVPAA